MWWLNSYRPQCQSYAVKNWTKHHQVQQCSLTVCIFQYQASSPHYLLFLYTILAKSDELPKKPLGQERPILLLPLQPDSRVDVNINLQPHSQPTTETEETDNITLHQTPSPVSQDSRSLSRVNTPSLPSPDPVVVHTQGTPSPLRHCRPPPVPPNKPCMELAGIVEKSLPEGSQDEGIQKNEPKDPETEEAVEWPPPYEAPVLDTYLQNEEENMDLPELPPPPFFYQEQSNHMVLDRESPCLMARAGLEMQHRSPSPCSASPLATQASPKPCLKPPTTLDLTQKNLSPSKTPSHRVFTGSSSSSTRPPPKPTKFPVSLYVPACAGDRRPSNTSQYDNLSEADEDDRLLERLLGSSPVESHNIPPYVVDRDYDPTLYPSPIPPRLCTLPFLPQEPECEGEQSWVEESIIPPPPPSFADRLSPFQDATARAVSPGYSKPFCRGPRDHSAFPAPLLYTGSPPGHSRSSGQSAVGVPLVQSGPDFCRMPQGGQQLPNSVTF